ncbi:NAD(P)/FAD-dependent oxidoreductase [Xylanimonas protaetiae]|uniref:NADH oxidase n=1 Tax=Xylanimonas protaetiae TaxID=2509457 RepID=A0A4P6FGY7_9MICO|nr:FAD-dependent oxidoreductase [Xylanimonas protaetiae]QAY69878.1 NADH oxidase [Xylanimonas protaetiae]
MRVVIVGGSHAGIACALRAREEFPDAQVVLYEKQGVVGFVAQSIPHYLRGSRDFLVLSSSTTEHELRAKGVEVRTETVVRGVDTAAKTLRYVVNGSDEVLDDTYDRLVLATGSYPSIPLAAGEYGDKLLVVKSYADAVRIKELMATARRVIVIGGGAIGIEMAKVMSDSRIATTLVQASSSILNRYLDDDVAAEVQAALLEAGVEVHTSALIVDISERTVDGRAVAAVTTRSGEVFTADGIIYATGFRPNTMLVGSQVTLGDRGAIVVDDYMRTSVPDVFAVGDCATTRVSHVAEPVYIPHASDALRQGEVAAVNLAGPRRRIGPSQATYNLNIGERTLCTSGINHRRALYEGYDSAVAFVRNDYLASDKFYKAWLTYERGTHKILGIQLRGTADGISAYADLVSLAIEQGRTVEDLEFTDFYFRHGFRNPAGIMNVLADVVRAQDPLR